MNTDDRLHGGGSLDQQIQRPGLGHCRIQIQNRAGHIQRNRGDRGVGRQCGASQNIPIGIADGCGKRAQRVRDNQISTRIAGAVTATRNQCSQSRTICGERARQQGGRYGQGCGSATHMGQYQRPVGHRRALFRQRRQIQHRHIAGRCWRQDSLGACLGNLQIDLACSARRVSHSDFSSAGSDGGLTQAVAVVLRIELEVVHQLLGNRGQTIGASDRCSHGVGTRYGGVRSLAVDGQRPAFVLMRRTRQRQRHGGPVDRQDLGRHSAGAGLPHRCTADRDIAQRVVACDLQRHTETCATAIGMVQHAAVQTGGVGNAIELGQQMAAHFGQGVTLCHDVFKGLIRAACTADDQGPSLALNRCARQRDRGIVEQNGRTVAVASLRIALHGSGRAHLRSQHVPRSTSRTLQNKTTGVADDEGGTCGGAGIGNSDRVASVRLTRFNLGLKAIGYGQHVRPIGATHRRVVLVANTQAPHITRMHHATQGQRDTGVVMRGILHAAGIRSTFLRCGVHRKVVQVDTAITAADDAGIRRGGVNRTVADKAQVTNGRVIEGEEIVLSQSLTRPAVVAAFLFRNRLGTKQESILGMLLHRNLQLVVHTHRHALLAKGTHLNVVGARRGDVLREVTIVGETVDHRGTSCVGQVQLAGGHQRGLCQLGRIQGVRQGPQAQHTGPQNAVARCVASVHIKNGADTGEARRGVTVIQFVAGQSGGQHLGGNGEGIEICMAVTGAQHRQVGQRCGTVDIAFGIDVPLGRVEILGNEYRVVYAEFIGHRRAEVSDDDGRARILQIHREG